MEKSLEQKIRQRWENMMMRCYNEAWRSKNPTYHHAIVCDEWHDYEAFLNWTSQFAEQINRGWDLDKDLLSDEVRIYSPTTCVFLPPIINRTLPKVGIWEKGVTKYSAAIRMKEFGEALEDGKYLIPDSAYKILRDIIDRYKTTYREKTGKELNELTISDKTDNNHGGPREGAGRKKNDTRAVTVRLTALAIERLELEKNKSKFVSRLIEGKIKEQDEVKCIRNENPKDIFDMKVEYGLIRYSRNGHFFKLMQLLGVEPIGDVRNFKCTIRSGYDAVNNLALYIVDPDFWDYGKDIKHCLQKMNITPQQFLALLELCLARADKRGCDIYFYECK